MEQITTALGGRAAEELVMKDISTGASNDIEIATSIAREMVTEYGMSSLGPINIKAKGGYSMWPGSEGESLSQDLQNKVDVEVKKIIDLAYKQAQTILKKNRAPLDKVAKELLDKETLDTPEFEKIVGKKKKI